MNRRLFTTLVAGALLTASTAFAQSTTYTIDPHHAEVEFEVRHFGLSKVRGTLSGVAGTIVWDEKAPAKSSVTATIDATTVHTPDETRNKHIKGPEFFNIEKYPTITFKSTSVIRNDGKLQVIGDLTLAGVTKSVTLDVDGPTPPTKGMSGGMVTALSATGMIKRSDFEFGTKSGASAVVGDEIKLTIDLEAAQK